MAEQGSEPQSDSPTVDEQLAELRCAMDEDGTVRLFDRGGRAPIGRDEQVRDG